MPVRFTSPSLGGTSGTHLKPHQWQLNVAYRRLHADQWYVGTEVRESAAPFGQPLFLDIESFDVSVDYGITDRLSLTLTLPFSYGTHSRFYADGNRHKVRSGGLGDTSLVGTVWLRNPTQHPINNFALGLGVKMPTGNNAVTDDFFLANGTVIQSPVDQAIQLGDGGWGIISQAQGSLKIFNRAYGYFNGWYLLTPRNMTSVNSPIPGVPLSVPDVYSARLGMAYALRPKQGISLSLGTRIDGIPIKDLIGGSDGFRRPGYNLFIEPGVAVARGRNIFTLSVPLRVHQNFKRSLVDVQLGKTGGGDLAGNLILFGYSMRFH